MITCKVCNTENDEYAIVCATCKSYIQNRIANLDFFQMVWKVIETPRQAFHDITLAEHKNYSLLLFSLFGVALSLTGFWYFKLGSRFDTLLDVLAVAVGVGIFVGFLCAGLFTVVFEITMRVMKGKGHFRGSFGVLAYATTPVSLSLVMILPIELLTFGMYLFTSNPDPYSMKPGLFIALVSFDALVGLWTFILSVIATSVSKQISMAKSFVAMLATATISLGILFILAKDLVRYV